MNLRWFMLFFLFSPSFVMASKLDSNSKVEDLSDFSGGLNTYAFEKKMNKSYSPSMYNLFGDVKLGSLSSLGGYTVLGATSTISSGNLIFEFKQSNSETSYVVSDSSVVLCTKDFQKYDFVRGNLNSNYQLDCAQVNNELWCTNGLDPIFSLDCTTVSVFDGKIYASTRSPNLPPSKFIEFADERVWLFNSTQSASALHFSNITSTDAEIIDPSDIMAWPSQNVINLDPGNGYDGTALWKYKTALWASKERGIYGISGTDEFNFSPLRVIDNVGVSSNRSISIDNGLTYFQGNNNFYIFDSVNVEPIGTNIQDRIKEIENNGLQLTANTWDSQAEFSKGKLYGTTVTVNGTLKLINPFPVNESEGIGPDTFSNLGSTSSHYQTMISTALTSHGDFSAKITTINVNYEWVTYQPPAFCQSPENIHLNITVQNTRTNVSSTSVNRIHPAGGGPVDPVQSYPIYFGDIDAKAQDFIDGNIRVLTEMDFAGGPVNCIINIQPIYKPGGSDFYLKLSSSQYISDIATISAINNWDILKSQYNENNGDIDFYVQAATSIVNFTTATWQSITPQTIINFPAAKNFIRWASTITANDENIFPSIDFTYIYHNAGGSSEGLPISTFFDDRWYVFASTIPGSDNRVGFAKSLENSLNKNAFFPISGINVASVLVTKDNNFYAGSSTSGVFLQLFGDNVYSFNGTPIDYYYEAPSSYLGDPYLKSKLSRVYMDFERSDGSTLDYGIAIDSATTSFRSIPIDGSGNTIKTIRNLPLGSVSQIKQIIKGTTQNNRFQFNGLRLIYLPTEIENE